MLKFCKSTNAINMQLLMIFVEFLHVYTMTRVLYMTTSGPAVYSETYESVLRGLCTALLLFILLSLYKTSTEKRLENLL